MKTLTSEDLGRVCGSQEGAEGFDSLGAHVSIQVAQADEQLAHRHTVCRQWA